MRSIQPNPPPPDTPEWRAAGLLYHSRNFFLKKKFGFPVWRVSIDAGLGCPNRDGTLAAGGCVFCNPDSFAPGRRCRRESITRQIDIGIGRIQARRKVDRFIAYFQPGTNTYAPARTLRTLYEEALAHPAIVGLAVGTRPDCVPDEVLDLLAELAGRTWVSVEYGLQTIHDRSLEWLRRGHRADAFGDAMARSRRRGLEVGAHVILGLPGESAEDIQATADELARWSINSVKLHNLHAVRGTPLADWVAAGKVVLPTREQYVSHAADFLERLPSGCVIDRLSGDAPPAQLVAPAWCPDKSAVRAAIEAELGRRGSYQGRGVRGEG